MTTVQMPAPSPMQHSERAKSRWAFFVWLFMLASFLSVRHRDAGDLMGEGGIDLQIKLQILAWFLLGLLALFLMGTKRAKVGLALQLPLFWYACYVLIAVASTAYSNSPELTLFRSGQLVVAMLLILSMGDVLNKHIHNFVFVFLLANWVLVIMANTGLDFGQSWIRGERNMFMLTNRHSLEPWRFSSPLAHASQVSIVGAVSAIGLAFQMNRENRGRKLPLVAFTTLTVILTVSRTAIAAMFLGFFIISILKKQWLPYILVAGIMVPIAILFTPIGDKVVQFGMRGQSADEFSSLTGRSDIYALGIERATNALPLGEGFQAGRANAIVAKTKGHSIVHSHNLFIESAVSMGILGLISAAMVLLTFTMALLMAIKNCPKGPIGVSQGWEPALMTIPLFSFCILDRGFSAPICPFVCIFISVLTLTTRMLLNANAAPEEASTTEVN